MPSLRSGFRSARADNERGDFFQSKFFAARCIDLLKQPLDAAKSNLLDESRLSGLQLRAYDVTLDSGEKRRFTGMEIEPEGT